MEHVNRRAVFGDLVESCIFILGKFGDNKLDIWEATEAISWLVTAIVQLGLPARGLADHDCYFHVDNSIALTLTSQLYAKLNLVTCYEMAAPPSVMNELYRTSG